MKYFIGLIVVFALSACGAGSGSSPAVDNGVPTHIPPTCKNLYSTWTSLTDHEVFDLTSLYAGAINQNFTFVGSDGSICGPMPAQITPPNPNANAGYDYQLAMTSGTGLSGSCINYVPPGSIGNRYAYALITMTACGEIKICQNYGSGLCKTFH
jgi:hypothetical protein